MIKSILYISYDRYEYLNYFHLVVNGQKVLQYVPSEMETEIDDNLKKKCETDGEIELCIVKDEEASEWEYQDFFRQNGYKIIGTNDLNTDTMCENMCEFFENDFVIGKEGDSQNKVELKVMFSGKVTITKTSATKEETKNLLPEQILKQAERILQSASHREKTELAQIIQEKYERMSKNE